MYDEIKLWVAELVCETNEKKQLFGGHLEMQATGGRHILKIAIGSVSDFFECFVYKYTRALTVYGRIRSKCVYLYKYEPYTV